MALMALAGGLAKGVAKNIIKKPKVNTKKFFDDVKETKEKSADSKPAGALVPSPGGSIVKVVDVKVDAEKKIKGETGDPLIREVSIIYQRTIDIQKALRKEQKAKRKRAKKKLRNDKKKKRGLRERLSEMGAGAGKAVMGTAAKAAQPITSLWDNIIKAFSFIMIGWLSRYLPQILGFAKTIVDGISAVGKFLTPIITPVWDAFIWISTKGTALISKLLGTDSNEADNKTLLGNIADIQKKTGFIEKAFAIFIISDMIGGLFQVAEGIGDFYKEHRKTINRQARRLYRRLPKPARNLVRKVTKVKPKQFLTNQLKKVKPKQVLQNQLKKVKPKQFLQKQLKKVKPLETGKNLLTKLKPKPGAGGGWLKGIRGGLSKGWQATSKAVVSGAKATGSAISGAWKAASEWTMKNLDSMWSGAKEWGAKQAAKFKNLKELIKNPGKLAQMMKGKLMSSVDDIVKKNKTLSQLTKMKPDQIMGSIKGMLNNAKKGKGILNVKTALSKAKNAKVAGIDKIITAVMSLIDYMLLKESPINAIIKGISGMLGYAAGFAIGAPFGGLPGFVTGSIGGALGELAGYGLLKGMAKLFPGLTETEDPIMNDGRPLLRDPDSPMDHMIKQGDKYVKGDQKDAPKSALEVKDNGEKSNDASQISESASYDKKGEHGTGGITPVPVDQMQGDGGGSSGGSKTTITTGGLNKLESANVDQNLRTKSKLYANG